MKAECVKRKYGINSDKNRIFPGLSGLIKINYKPDPEYTFNVALPDGVKIKQVHAKSIEWITDQRKVRNIIGIYAGFIPPRVKDGAYQEVLDVLFTTASSPTISFIFSDSTPLYILINHSCSAA